MATVSTESVVQEGLANQPPAHISQRLPILAAKDEINKVPKPTLTSTSKRGRTSKPIIQPQIGNAWVAYQALGLPSPDALVKKFTRKKNPWPERFRARDNNQWLYDIAAIKAWLIPTAQALSGTQD